MNNVFLCANGLLDIDPLIYFIVSVVLIIVLFVLFILQNSKLKKLENKYKKFMKGRDARSLEDEIYDIFEEQRVIRNENEQNRVDINDINRRMTRTFQKIGLERYDAFNIGGGKLSFALCLLDEMDNGFLMNSVHSTDGINYAYVKDIRGGVSDSDLSSEERIALDMALEGVRKKKVKKNEVKKNGRDIKENREKNISGGDQDDRY